MESRCKHKHAVSHDPTHVICLIVLIDFIMHNLNQLNQLNQLSTDLIDLIDLIDLFDYLNDWKSGVGQVCRPTTAM